MPIVLKEGRVVTLYDNPLTLKSSLAAKLPALGAWLASFGKFRPGACQSCLGSQEGL
jgi:hypothetical protein